VEKARVFHIAAFVYGVIASLPAGEKLSVAGGTPLVQTAKLMELPSTPSLPSIQQLKQEHSLYERRLDTLRDKMFLTDAEQLEEVRLKKLKLSLKDEMERLRRLGAA
jgi:hypothetical protein